MQLFPATVVWRHRKENLKKCSLRGLESRSDFQFFTYPGVLPDLNGYIVLDLEAPPLSEADGDKGLLIVDATWRYAKTMMESVTLVPGLIRRSIPDQYRTAYPRRQEDCPAPERGLASLEAIYVAYHLLGRDTTGLLEGYYWKDLFFERNKDL
ncbi:MAG: hypothetical protein H0X51_02065 [Parachlamydiaceae bacterium]|nr:hypothetical protein [Parachlamydiaceae bacterium]